MTGMTDSDIFGHAPVSIARGMTDDDIFSRKAPPPLPGTSDEDLITRAVLAEGDPNNTQSWQTIAGVIRNRMKRLKMTAAEVLSQPAANGQYQFESYGNGHIQAVDPKSSQYDAAFKAIKPVLSGDITVPYDTFQQPDIVASRKSPAPFDASLGTRIGTQVFYDSTQGKPSVSDTLSMVPAPVIEPGSDPGVINSKTHSRWNEAQQTAVRRDQALGYITPNPAGGSFYKGVPLLAGSPDTSEQDVPENTYYYDPLGNLQYSGKKKSDFVHGALEGAADVGLSTAGNLPGAKNSEAIQRLQSYQNDYDAAYRGSPASDFGRFTGQVLATTPVLGGVGGLTGSLMRTAPALAPAVDFLAGKTGGNLFVKGSSLASNGFLQGAGAGGLTSSTDHTTSVGDQMLRSGVLGAVASPVLHGGGSLFSKTSRLPSNLSDLANKAVNKFGITDLTVPQIKGAVDKVAGPSDPEAAKLYGRLLNAPGSGYVTKYQNGLKQFTQAVAGTFGLTPEEAANGLTETAMELARKREGSVIGDYASKRNISGSKLSDLLSSLAELKTQIPQAMQSNEASPLLSTIENIENLAKDGSLSGEQYKALIKYKSPFFNLQKAADPNIRHYAHQIRDALDTGIRDYEYNPSFPDDHWAQIGQKAENDAFDQSIRRYKNLMTIQGLAAKAGYEGVISPTQLQGVVNKKFPDSAFHSPGDLGDLADIGQAFFNQKPNKSNLFYHGLGTLLGGDAVFVGLHDPVTALKNTAYIGAAAAGRHGINAVRGMVHGQSAKDFIQQSLKQKVVSNPFLESMTDKIGVPASVIGANNFFQQPRQ